MRANACIMHSADTCIFRDSYMGKRPTQASYGNVSLNKQLIMCGHNRIHVQSGSVDDYCILVAMLSTMIKSLYQWVSSISLSNCPAGLTCTSVLRHSVVVHWTKQNHAVQRVLS